MEIHLLIYFVALQSTPWEYCCIILGDILIVGDDIGVVVFIGEVWVESQALVVCLYEYWMNECCLASAYFGAVSKIDSKEIFLKLFYIHNLIIIHVHYVFYSNSLRSKFLDSPSSYTAFILLCAICCLNTGAPTSWIKFKFRLHFEHYN